MEAPAISPSSRAIATQEHDATGSLRPSQTPFQRDGFIQLRIAGRPWEMGLQHGEMLRTEIQDLLAAVSHHVLYGQPGVVGRGTRLAVRTATRCMAPFIPARFREEMRGIARAANVPYRDILLLNCFDDVLANLRLVGDLVARLGCSTFGLLPDRTGTRELFCGRNLDYFVNSAAGDDVWAATNYMKQHLAVIEMAPEGAAAFTTVGWPGFVGTVTAMSERRMVVGSMTVATWRNWPLATPAGFLYREIMERCGSIDEASTLLRGARRTQGNNVLVGSGAEGEAVVIELTPRSLATRRPTDGWIAATNHFNDPEMIQRTGEQHYASSTDRYARLNSLCGAVAARSIADAQAFLTDIELPRTDSNEYCSVLNPCTVYSVAFAPARGRLWVRAADRVDRQFQEVMGPRANGGSPSSPPSPTRGEGASRGGVR